MDRTSDADCILGERGLGVALPESLSAPYVILPVCHGWLARIRADQDAALALWVHHFLEFLRRIGCHVRIASLAAR